MHIPGRRRVTAAAVFVVAATASVVGQTAQRRAGDLLPAGPPVTGPAAIAGLASSARHCVSADAANVHAIGYADIGTSYTIRFDSDIDLVAAVGRINLAAGVGSTNYGILDTDGKPFFNSGVTTPGTMALWVGGNGQAGCYRYQVTVRPPATATVATEPSTPNPPVVEPAAIAGLASSARYCVGGHLAANVHEIGRVEAGSRVTLTFDSDFNPIAAVALIDPAAQRHTYSPDDNSGGANQPRIAFVAPFGGTMAIFVAGNNSVGCYRYKVDFE